jgi:hypothetical protein
MNKCFVRTMDTLSQSSKLGTYIQDLGLELPKRNRNIS